MGFNPPNDYCTGQRHSPIQFTIRLMDFLLYLKGTLLINFKLSRSDIP